ncbi:MAG: hypothetical protein K6F61_01725 [Clostridiales bacterium]|nr:hypothetical protein [Clostridiales bacterium]
MMAELCQREENRQKEVSLMYAYCLFCETQRCKKIAEYINRNYGCLCISPQIIQKKWVKGVPKEESHDWLPGYLFVYTRERIIPRFDISGIIRCLGNTELSGQDLAFAEMIRLRKGVIGGVVLVHEEGARCRINDPAWEGFFGRVIKMDRGRQRCCIEFEFDGTPHTVWVGYEITEII